MASSVRVRVREDATHRDFMEKLGKKLGFNEMRDWYKLSQEDLKRHGGASLLKDYNGSPSLLLRSVFPELPWAMNLFVSQNEHRAFMDGVAKRLGLRGMDEWYRVTREDIRKCGGGSLLDRHGGCRPLLVAAYPEHEWIPWKFRNLQTDLDDREKVDFVGWLGEELMVRRLEDWYRVSWKQIGEKKSVAMLKKYPLEHLLPLAYPEHPWDLQRLQTGFNKPSQRYLARVLEEIFPDTKVLENYLHEEMKRSESGRRMELDVYIPEKKLAFEYQGEQHYRDIHALGKAWSQKEKDEEKRRSCKEGGITLIEIPYWWDKEKDSLMATIHERRPDLVVDSVDAKPIPLEPTKEIPQGGARDP